MFTCKHAECAKKFAQKSNLANHLSKVHADFSLLPYRCPVGARHGQCDKRFSSVRYAHSHLRKVHHVADAEARFANLVPQLTRGSGSGSA